MKTNKEQFRRLLEEKVIREHLDMTLLDILMKPIDHDRDRCLYLHLDNGPQVFVVSDGSGGPVEGLDRMPLSTLLLTFLSFMQGIDK